MDPEHAQLAAAAGATLVSLLTTEVWGRAREGFVSLWHGTDRSRADAIGAEIDVTREELLNARTSGDVQVIDELGAEWQGRVRRFLSTYPEALQSLRDLIEELAPLVAEPATATVTQHATAAGHGRVYQAGRDQHIGRVDDRP